MFNISFLYCLEILFVGFIGTRLLEDNSIEALLTPTETGNSDTLILDFTQLDQ